MLSGNYVVIQGDSRRKIEMGKDGSVSSAFRKEFKLDGPDSGASGLVMLMIKGLVGDASPVNVELNGNYIGKIHPNPNASPDSWFTQILHFSASEGKLRPNKKDDGVTNVIQIPGESRKHEKAENVNQFQKFYVQNVICFYKQP
ncbi:MAG: hypothetical protein ACPGWR_20085 [Ardenticatenaceae bacterium]